VTLARTLKADLIEVFALIDQHGSSVEEEANREETEGDALYIYISFVFWEM
jgi:hypothetical protein